MRSAKLASSRRCLAFAAGLVDGLVFENPGVVVGDEDGVEAGGEGGVDVGAGAVADHPGGGGFEGVVAGEGAVGVGVFFGEDLDLGEEVREAGAGELVLLLGLAALGDEDEAMALGEVGEGDGRRRGGARSPGRRWTGRS